MTSINPLAHANWEGSAKQYDAFESRWHYYEKVAEKLVAPLGIKPDAAVLELASGTGACTLLLSRLCPSGRVVCVEKSPTMVALARKNMKAAKRDNVTFLLGEVERLQAVVGKERFDFVVCNSAFWQFKESDKVAAAVSRLLAAGGSFAFNIPSLYSFTRERLAYRNAIERILDEHGIDHSGFWHVREQLDFVGLLKWAGFDAVEEQRYYVTISAAQAEQWRKIPVFARRWGNFAILPREVAAEILEAVQEMKLEDQKERRSEWRLVVARKSN